MGRQRLHCRIGREIRKELIDRHESARGPTTTAKFNLMEPEELMNQEFNSDDWCVVCPSPSV